MVIAFPDIVHLLLWAPTDLRPRCAVETRTDHVSRAGEKLAAGLVTEPYCDADVHEEGE